MRRNASSETRPDYLLILPWNFKDEIMKQNAYIREWGGQFVVPIPRCKNLFVISQCGQTRPELRALAKGGVVMKVVLFCGGLGIADS